MQIKENSIMMNALNDCVSQSILTFSQALAIASAVEYCANRKPGDRTNDQEEGISEFTVESCRSLCEEP